MILFAGLPAAGQAAVAEYKFERVSLDAELVSAQREQFPHPRAAVFRPEPGGQFAVLHKDLVHSLVDEALINCLETEAISKTGSSRMGSVFSSLRKPTAPLLMISPCSEYSHTPVKPPFS